MPQSKSSNTSQPEAGEQKESDISIGSSSSSIAALIIQQQIEKGRQLVIPSSDKNGTKNTK